MSFDIDGSGLLKGLSEHEFKMQTAVQKYGETAGKKMEAYAKENKPWTDHTGNAKNSIRGGAENHGGSTDVYISGNMEYSPYLELANEKKYAILWPAVDKLGEKILSGMSKLLDRL